MTLRAIVEEFRPEYEAIKRVAEKRIAEFAAEHGAAIGDLLRLDIEFCSAIRVLADCASKQSATTAFDAVVERYLAHLGGKSDAYKSAVIAILAEKAALELALSERMHDRIATDDDLPKMMH